MKSKKCLLQFIGALCLTFVCLTLSVSFLFVSNSSAGDTIIGVVEISQKKVPLVITDPGSYRLISNLIVSSPDVSAITNNADNVTIDLNGFTISGPGKGVSGIGIKNDMRRGVYNVVVKNGTVRAWGIGIHLHGTNNRVENVRVLEAGHGIFVGASSVVSQCQVAFCVVGIGTEDGTMVLNNTIYSMDNRCIGTSGGNTPIGGVTVIGNNCRLSHVGIKVIGQGNRIEGNTITQYSQTGIDLTEGNANYFAKNLLQDDGTLGVKSWDGESDDIDGGLIDPALSNIILPSYVP